MTTSTPVAAENFFGDLGRDARQRAIDYVRKLSPEHAARVDRELTEMGFWRAGEGAAYTAQMHSMRLPPWYLPPVWIEAPWLPSVESMAANRSDLERRRMARLLLRMRAAGIHACEPEPLRALARVRKKRKPAA
jgi:hypothetical protein